jgi:hypothetical protein
MQPSLGCQDSETKAENFCSRSCARVRPRIFVLDENLLHIRTNTASTCLQFLQRSNVMLRVNGGYSGQNSECTALSTSQKAISMIFPAEYAILGAGEHL